MIIEEEQRRDCVDFIITEFTKTSAFRSRKAIEYPDDPRNLRAAETLKKLAIDAAGLADSDWNLLQLFYDPHSPCWRKKKNYIQGYGFRT
jgi:hypothetical protein